MYLTSDKLITDVFMTVAQPILINEAEQSGIITNAHLGMDSRRHLHALQPFEQGNYVEFGEGVYMVVEDVVNVRGAKYKSTIEYCNYTVTTPEIEGGRIEVGRDEFGRPIYDYADPIPGRNVQCILNLDNVRVAGSQIRLTTGGILMLVPDTDENRNDFKVNDEYEIYDNKMRITELNRLRKGLIEVSLEVKA